MLMLDIPNLLLLYRCIRLVFVIIFVTLKRTFIADNDYGGSIISFFNMCFVFGLPSKSIHVRVCPYI